MQKQGTVIRWNSERAFGFIRSPDTAAEVFFHVRDYQGGKGPRAMAVRSAMAPAGRPAASARRGKAPPVEGGAHARKAHPAPGSMRPQARQRKSVPTGQSAAFLLMLGWSALMGWGVWAGRLPLWALGAAVAVNLLTFATYAMDKSAAENGQWRTRESHLHLLALAGGWPGAWFAQQWLRHKSRKVQFRAVYWATVVIHCAALAAWVGGWLSA
ncbi:DUF1294 domain-containing protein [Paracidovorax sp. MALMAid1276]|uniref:DUF1294 domain-containing protein n=1 Tax=Paracidovorax sp. MALMAid1276 TaxID=3411631 RepID=UPI003B9C27B6